MNTATTIATAAAGIAPFWVDIERTLDKPVGAAAPEVYRQYQRLSDAERLHFQCGSCHLSIGTTRADLPRFWHAGTFEHDEETFENGELLCPGCMEPSAPGTYELADVWYPISGNMVWSWRRWDDLFRDWVIQGHSDLEDNWRRVRRELREDMPAALREWARVPGRLRQLPDGWEASAVVAAQYAALDMRVALMEGVYDWATGWGTPITVPGAVAWPVGRDRSTHGGLAPHIYHFFCEFLDSHDGHWRGEWERFVAAWDKNRRKSK